MGFGGSLFSMDWDLGICEAQIKFAKLQVGYV